MPFFKPSDEAYTKINVDKKLITIIKKDEFEKFNPSLLGLGNISNKSKATGAITAIFDLEGFTNFCKQIDPQLSVPLFLNQFLEWIFSTIRTETCEKEYKEGNALWHPLPFFAKFMGDGILVLWESESMTEKQQHNLIITLSFIGDTYLKKFLPAMKRKVSAPPNALRCGIAKGTVYSVGDEHDFVGPCINLAARLQKLDCFSFAFSRRGFNPEDNFVTESLEAFVLKKTDVRGMGEGEIIYLLKDEFEKAPLEIQKKYVDP